MLTLEPLVDAVLDGVEGAGWALSGLQKTTSHHFEGRWEGAWTRSAYLFFHRPDVEDTASVDVYLNETSKGLEGNLALVVDGPLLAALGDSSTALASLASAASGALPEGYRTPVTLRFGLTDAESPAAEATSEVRFKLRIPNAALDAGASAVSALASATVRSFETLLAHPDVQAFVAGRT